MNIFTFPKETIVVLTINEDLTVSNKYSPIVETQICSTCAKNCLECINKEDCTEPMKFIGVGGETSPFYLTSGKVCWIKNCASCKSFNKLTNYSKDVGEFGAQCTCPDGGQYPAGVYKNDQTKVACVNGEASNEISLTAGNWSYKKVLCATINYEGFEYNETQMTDFDKYSGEICYSCRENFCFFPINSKKRTTDMEYRNTACESVVYFSSTDQMEEDHFKAEQDSLNEKDERVLLTDNIYCQCEYSGQIYQVGKWKQNYDTEYDMTLPPEIRATIEDLKEQETIKYYRDSKFVIEDYDIACINGRKINEIPLAFEGGPKASVICHKYHYCYKCPWPCKTCTGAQQNNCMSCIEDHVFAVEGDVLDLDVEKPIGFCNRPKPLAKPKLIWSNVKYRIQMVFESAIIEKKFEESIKMTLRGGTPLDISRRRILSGNENDHGNERILEEEDIDVKIKTAELSDTKKLLNIYFANSENRSDAMVKFEVTDYTVFQSQDDKNRYLQDLFFEIIDVNIYQSGMEEVLKSFFSKVAAFLRMVMTMC